MRLLLLFPAAVLIGILYLTHRDSQRLKAENAVPKSKLKIEPTPDRYRWN